MARTKLEVCPKEFQHQVNVLESNNQFKNLGQLWLALEKTQWARDLKLSKAVAYLRAKEFKITTKTVVGKRGNSELGKGPKGPRKPRKEKLKAYSETFELLRKKIPIDAPAKDGIISGERWHSLIVRAEEGSLKAFVALNCIECSGFAPTVVKNCNIVGCGMYPIRPYRETVEIEEVLQGVENGVASEINEG